MCSWKRRDARRVPYVARSGTIPHFGRSGQKSKMCSGSRQSEDKFSSYRSPMRRTVFLTWLSQALERRRKKTLEASSRLVLFDGTNGHFVNTSTHLSDQERAPVAPDLKRLMREKARRGQVTFGLTADVREAHRQISVHPDD